MVLFRTLGQAREHPWEEHALKTAWMYKRKCACFVLLPTRKGRWQKGSSRRQRKKWRGKGKKELLEGNTDKEFWSLDNISTKRMTWYNPPKRDLTIAVQVPGPQADTHLTCPTELHQPTPIRPLVHICIRLLDQSVKLGSLWSGSHVFTDVWTKHSTMRLWSFWTSGS